VRVPRDVEQGEVTRVRPDDRAVLVDFGDAVRAHVVADDKLAADVVTREKEQASQRIGVNVALESHVRPALDVDDDPVSIVTCGLDWLPPGVLR
jgi:hypothetical protein